MITIRRFRDEDAATMTDIYARAVAELGPKSYGPEQVAIWASLQPNPDQFKN